MLAHSEFVGNFDTSARELLDFLTKGASFVSSLAAAQETPSSILDKLRGDPRVCCGMAGGCRDLLITEPCTTWAQCVGWARRKYQSCARLWHRSLGPPGCASAPALAAASATTSVSASVSAFASVPAFASASASAFASASASASVADSQAWRVVTPLAPQTLSHASPSSFTTSRQTRPLRKASPSGRLRSACHGRSPSA